jgi:hypothetical protein
MYEAGFLVATFATLKEAKQAVIDVVFEKYENGVHYYSQGVEIKKEYV